MKYILKQSDLQFTKMSSHDQLDSKAKRRLEVRSEIARTGVKHLWTDSPPRSHDHEYFDPKIYGDIFGNDSDSNDMKKHLKEDHHSSKSKKSKKEKKSEKRKKSHKKSKKSHKKKSKKASDHSSSESSSEEEAIEINIDKIPDLNPEVEVGNFDLMVTKKKKETSSKNEEIVGPAPDQLLKALDAKSSKPLDYGRALLPGEGAAMAKFVQEGKRIPRRGEIGLTSEEIESFEESGFVMSGSRHRRMEAVRLRKENQIYSADEKRVLATFNYDARKQKESNLMNQFRELIHSKKSESK